MKIFVLATAVAAIAVPAPGIGSEPCSIHPSKGLSEAQLSSLAKLTQPQAEKLALAQFINGPGITISSAELESEHGCLIWSFDLKIGGESGVEEVQIDAGNGKVLSTKHESAGKEAAEKSAESATKRIK